MVDIKELILGSSNKSKIQEYQNFGLDIKTKSIPDLKEVDGSELDVILYKILELKEENVLVEDSTLTVENAQVGVNTKWLMNELKYNPDYHGRKASWFVYIGFLHQNQVYVCFSEIKGTISQNKVNDKAFGFDSIFIPEGSINNETLYDLSVKGLKENYSPRKQAVVKIIDKKYDLIKEVKNMPVWTGKYQNES